MADSGGADSTADLAHLLARLNSYLDGSAADGTTRPAPSAHEAMATYRSAARVVELQLVSGPRDPRDLALTRKVLLGTHRLLCAALDQAEQASATGPIARPALQVLDGGRADR